MIPSNDLWAIKILLGTILLLWVIGFVHAVWSFLIGVYEGACDFLMRPRKG